MRRLPPPAYFWKPLPEKIGIPSNPSSKEMLGSYFMETNPGFTYRSFQPSDPAWSARFPGLRASGGGLRLWTLPALAAGPNYTYVLMYPLSLFSLLTSFIWSHVPLLQLLAVCSCVTIANTPRPHHHHRHHQLTTNNSSGAFPRDST